ncbi:Zn-ribbon domain-containing OB-fold protein [Actinomadura algeriensis]|uniref:OB-fold protein n=1 Tax=Actinomadura algeriensis TaxID=1679523 RepID=A0ABR9JYC4_9ACTN|nr:OB-fold domain-containing protein [Actinomadura algeriensis]MBE1535379.1 putative OB-fold protein [Actinomadura algeriensis]
MDIGVLRRDGRTDPFFDGAAADRLVIKHCASCDHRLTPDAGDCPDCGTTELAWADASGAASLVTWTVTHGRPAADGTVPPPAFLALVELAEGPWLHARLDGVERAELREGLPLRAVFAHPDEGEPYMLFRPWTE